MEQTRRFRLNLQLFGVWFVASAFILTASLIGLSRILEKEMPDASLTLNPLNSNALVASLTNELNSQNGPPQLAALFARTESALRFDIGDARLFSLAGEVRYQQGDQAAAQSLFDHARTLSKTEIHALLRSINRSVEIGKWAEAVGEVDILLRRWPDQLPAISEGLPAILSTPDGYQAVLTAIAAEAPWRARLFSELKKSRLGMDLANRLLLDLVKSHSPPKSSELSAFINGYIFQKDYEAAYRLFLFSLSDKERALSGYVFNSSFEPPPSGKPFDWQIPSNPGIEVTFAGSGGAPGSEKGVHIQFLNTPVKNVGLEQYIELPSGSYRLSFAASGEGLKFPRDLFWSVRCSDTGAELIRIEIPQGTFQHKALSQVFSIGSPPCRLQLLRLETASIPESWRFRYVGKLVIHQLTVERITS